VFPWGQNTRYQRVRNSLPQQGSCPAWGKRKSCCKNGRKRASSVSETPAQARTRQTILCGRSYHSVLL